MSEAEDYWISYGGGIHHNNLPEMKFTLLAMSKSFFLAMINFEASLMRCHVGNLDVLCEFWTSQVLPDPFIVSSY